MWRQESRRFQRRRSARVSQAGQDEASEARGGTEKMVVEAYEVDEVNTRLLILIQWSSMIQRPNETSSAYNTHQQYQQYQQHSSLQCSTVQYNIAPWQQKDECILYSVFCIPINPDPKPKTDEAQRAQAWLDWGQDK